MVVFFLLLLRKSFIYKSFFLSLGSGRSLAKGNDSIVEVYISAVDHPGHFWVQDLDRSAQQLTKLVHDMTAFYGEFKRPCVSSITVISHFHCVDDSAVVLGWFSDVSL